MSSYGSLSPSEEGPWEWDAGAGAGYYCSQPIVAGVEAGGQEGLCWGGGVAGGDGPPLYHHYVTAIHGYEDAASEDMDSMIAAPAPAGYGASLDYSYIGVECGGSGNGTGGVVRVVRRRNTANRKERRRTQSINTAFTELRDCIPNVPPDTKLSKIKTLRLATSYIGYLLRVLREEECEGGSGGGGGEVLAAFRADLSHAPTRQRLRNRPSSRHTQEVSGGENVSSGGSKGRGRTGWPHHVWALELEQPSTQPPAPPAARPRDTP